MGQKLIRVQAWMLYDCIRLAPVSLSSSVSFASPNLSSLIIRPVRVKIVPIIAIGVIRSCSTIAEVITVTTGVA